MMDLSVSIYHEHSLLYTRVQVKWFHRISEKLWKLTKNITKPREIQLGAFVENAESQGNKRKLLKNLEKYIIIFLEISETNETRCKQQLMVFSTGFRCVYTRASKGASPTASSFASLLILSNMRF